MFTGQTLGHSIVNANLTGPIPPSMGHIPVLSYLTLRNIPALTGPIPTTFANSTFLKNLAIRKTAFSGPIPSFLGTMDLLVSLDLSCYNLSGSIRDTLRGRMFYSVDLSRNKLTGSNPASLYVGGLTNPSLFSRNQLTGPIPRALSKINFDTIDLSRNRLAGYASFLFTKIWRLTDVDLSGNALEFDMSNLALYQDLVLLVLE